MTEDTTNLHRYVKIEEMISIPNTIVENTINDLNNLHPKMNAIWFCEQTNSYKYTTNYSDEIKSPEGTEIITKMKNSNISEEALEAMVNKLNEIYHRKSNQS